MIELPIDFEDEMNFALLCSIFDMDETEAEDDLGCRDIYGFVGCYIDDIPEEEYYD